MNLVQGLNDLGLEAPRAQFYSIYLGTTQKFPHLDAKFFELQDDGFVVIQYELTHHVPQLVQNYVNRGETHLGLCAHWQVRNTHYHVVCECPKTYDPQTLTTTMQGNTLVFRIKLKAS